MTRVVIVGEIFNADLSVGGGPAPGGPNWSGPVDPGFGGGWTGLHPGNRPPGSYPGGHPGNRPPGSWGGPVDPGWGSGSTGGEHPGNRPPGSGEYPSGGPIYGGGHPSGQPIVPPQGGTDVPEDVYQPAPVPEEFASQYVVSVYDPKTMDWTTKTYPPR
jgi:hypothetical protein